MLRPVLRPRPRLIPVVVGTHPDRKDWLQDCIKSIRATTRNRRVHIHRHGGYEVAALRAGINKYRRFLFLHDSCEILDPEFWEHIDSTPPAWLYGAPHMYLGVFDSDQLAHAIRDAPEHMDKQASINWEGELGIRLQMPTLWPEVTDANSQFAERHGRTNRVLGNHLARKFKGNWGQT